MKIKLLIAAGDRDYEEHLSQRLMDQYADTFEIMLCAAAEQVLALAERQRSDVAPLSRELARGAEAAGVPEVHSCDTREEAEALLPQVLEPDSTVLVKASRGMKLEALTQRLLELAPEE